MEKIKLMTIVGTRPEIIRLSAVIKKCDRYFNQLLVHTGQNYDYTLNQIFFEDLELRAPDFYLNAVGSDLGETIGNIIAKSYALMAQQRQWAERVQALPPLQASILTMRYGEGLPWRKIAERTGYSEKHLFKLRRAALAALSREERH